MRSSDSIADLAAALVAAQAEMGNAPKSAYNPHYDSRYADLAEVWATCRGPLTRHGLAVTQVVSPGEHHPILETVLIHRSGQWIGSDFPLLGEIGKPQTLGWLITYARRYSLAAIVGIAQDDDDANAATPAIKAAARAANDREPGPRARPSPRPSPRKPPNGRNQPVHPEAVKATHPVIAWILSRKRDVNDRFAAAWKMVPGRDPQARPPLVIRTYYEVQNHFITQLIKHGMLDEDAVNTPDGVRDNVRATREFLLWFETRDDDDARKAVAEYLAHRLEETMREAGLDPDLADDGVATADADATGEAAR